MAPHDKAQALADLVFPLQAAVIFIGIACGLLWCAICWSWFQHMRYFVECQNGEHGPPPPRDPPKAEIGREDVD